ncbi:tRNA dimethylallyltransferase 2 [Asparagus officinalis]|uniref:RAB6-interacting golgin n=1 Tax=Asparagus officinalis TaxID=4686 RepID=A0A5P1E436_ASPOF|nr:tRNA dimethylallyltransferase 2 [Asparagus officinalis]
MMQMPSPEQQQQYISRIKDSGGNSCRDSPAKEDKEEEEMSRSALSAFRAKEEQIERKKLEVREKVFAQLGRVEEESKRLAEIREELEAMADPTRKEVAAVRKRIDVVNRELKPLGQSCLKKEKEYKDALEAFNEKNKEKSQLVNKLMEIIDDILSRDGLPVIVGGTNYYIQALVSPFLIDDAVQDMEEDTVVSEQELSNVDLAASYEIMFVIVPRIPGIFSVSGLIHRRFLQINRYLSLYASSGVLPSTLFQGKAAENWGRADNFRFNCCFIWLDVSLPVLDKYVDQRVDCMIDSGLLLEVYDIYKPNADYTRGLRQAIGAREFEEFFKECFLEIEASGFPCLEGNASSDNAETGIPILRKKADNSSGATLVEILCSRNYRLQYLLDEAIDKLKSNTRKLVRRQIRRLNRLKTYFGWDLHYVDATEAFLCNSGDMWHAKVVEPCIGIVNTFLSEKVSVLTLSTEIGDVRREGHVSRDLWSQYICEACGNRVLRGAHEWEQHKQGRGHRKRILSLRKKSLQ